MPNSLKKTTADTRKMKYHYQDGLFVEATDAQVFLIPRQSSKIPLLLHPKQLLSPEVQQYFLDLSENCLRRLERELLRPHIQGWGERLLHALQKKPDYNARLQAWGIMAECAHANNTILSNCGDSIEILVARNVQKEIAENNERGIRYLTYARTA